MPDRRLNLEQLRKQARELLRQFRAGDAEALARYDAQLARRPSVLQLAHAQFVLAREAGFASWPRLKAYLETPRFWYGRTTALLLREMLLDRGALDGVTSLIANGLEHPNARVRYECAHLLDLFGDDRCVPTLTRLLEDPVPRVRAIALHSLVCDACKLTPLQSRPDLLALTIEWASNDPHRRVRQEATRVLAESNEPEAIAALRKLGVKRRAPPVRRAIPSCLPDRRGPARPVG